MAALSGNLGRQWPVIGAVTDDTAAGTVPASHRIPFSVRRDSPDGSPQSGAILIKTPETAKEVLPSPQERKSGTGVPAV